MNNKKAFTIVELVIVIAVIAVLASVLIPSFTTIIKMAKQSKFEQQAAQHEKLEFAESMLGIERETEFIEKPADGNQPDTPEDNKPQESFQNLFQALYGLYDASGRENITPEQLAAFNALPSKTTLNDIMDALGGGANEFLCWTLSGMPHLGIQMTWTILPGESEIIFQSGVVQFDYVHDVQLAYDIGEYVIDKPSITRK